MKYFVIEYHLQTRELKLQEHSDAEEARVARREAENRLSNEWEVVTLSSNSLEAIKRTHSRYFYSAAEILQQTVDHLSSSPVRA